jgi:hypothetical protein
MRKEHGLSVFENRALRKMFYSQEGGRKMGMGRIPKYGAS